MRPKGSPKELEARRLRAMELLRKGLGPYEIAKEVGSTAWSVYRWKEKMEKGGKKALKAQPHPHRPCRLSVEQKKELQRLLLQGALVHGYIDQLWTLPRIACLIKKHFGVTYHPAHVWKILHSLGWSCQKPQRCARQKNTEEVEKWRKENWPHIKKRQRTK